MTTFRCAAILFDLDGVLVDSTRSVERQWRAWARERRVDEEKVAAVAHGVRAIEVVRALAPHLDAETEVRNLEAREADDRDGVLVMPGAVKLVNEIPERRWGVVTSGTRHLATARLKLAGIPVPRVMITADDVVNGKPHPEPYLKGAELLGVKPEDCLVIEDAPAGIQSAHLGGMKVIAFASTFGKEELGDADAVIQSFSQLSVVVQTAYLLLNVDGWTRSMKGNISRVRVATPLDTSAIVALTNAAFAVETFLDGTRTNEADLAEKMDRGELLLGYGGKSDQLVASVYVEIRGTRGYFGMLAVDPAHQGEGLGRAMVRAAEDYCREQGCTAMDLSVLSLRPELLPLYRKLGYVENGTEQFRPSRPFKNGMDCHCILMSKKL